MTAAHTKALEALNELIEWVPRMARDGGLYIKHDGRMILARAESARALLREPVAEVHKTPFNWNRKTCPCGCVQSTKCKEEGCQWENDPALVPEHLRKPWPPVAEAPAAVPLTDAQLRMLALQWGLERFPETAEGFARAIEAAHNINQPSETK